MTQIAKVCLMYNLNYSGSKISNWSLGRMDFKRKILICNMKHRTISFHCSRRLCTRYKPIGMTQKLRWETRKMSTLQLKLKEIILPVDLQSLQLELYLWMHHQLQRYSDIQAYKKSHNQEMNVVLVSTSLCTSWQDSSASRHTKRSSTCQ